MPETFTGEEMELLYPFVSNVDKDVFALKNLPEVVKGALFSRYSRSAKSLRRLLLDEFIRNEDIGFREIVKSGAAMGFEKAIAVEKAEEFYERVLVGFGDDSVGELAFSHIALENISNMASKAVEDPRIGISPLEKSTRYVLFDKKADDGEYLFYRDKKIMGQFPDDFTDLMNLLFDTYASLVEKMRAYVIEKYPKEGDASDRAYDSAVRAKTCDIIRGLLPAATLTNVGLAGNGRAFEYLLVKMRAHPLSEMNGLASEMHRELSTSIRPFVKRVYGQHGDEWIDYINGSASYLKASLPHSSNGGSVVPVRMVSHYGTMDDVIALLMFENSDIGMDGARKIASAMPEQKKAELISGYFALRKNRRQKPSRAFESVGYLFEINGNYGIFRDLQRHRILTQMKQDVSTRLGFDMPDEIGEAGFSDLWNDAMYKSAELYEKVYAKLPKEASYCVPFAYRIRWAFGLNLREAFHFIELRSGEQGHPDYRKVAIEMQRQIQEVHPVIGQMKFLNTNKIGLERMNSEKRIDEKLESIRKRYG
jgi:thymidylate synthase ThyX